MSEDHLICRICGHDTENRVHQIREMMFGTRESFAYLECSACGCLQLTEIPSDMSRFYPRNYYAYQNGSANLRQNLKAFVDRHVAAYRLGLGDTIGWGLARLRRTPDYVDWLRRTQVNSQSEILDVGCGGGVLLSALKRVGFQHLTGIDPFLDQDRTTAEGVKLYRKSIHELDRTFDLVMLHHVLEHMNEPLKVLQTVQQLLKPNGRALIRTPLAGTYCWRTYETDWVQLDAPRHFFIYTASSIALLAEKAGLKVVDVVHDSTEFQFWGSEQYARDIPLMDSRSLAVNRQSEIFNANHRRDFRRRAVELNASCDGDAAAFYLQKQ